MTPSHSWLVRSLRTVQPMKTWMRRSGDRVRITTGKYAGRTGTIESNVYQRTVDYPDEFANGHHVMLDSEDLATLRWDRDAKEACAKIPRCEGCCLQDICATDRSLIADR